MMNKIFNKTTYLIILLLLFIGLIYFLEYGLFPHVKDVVNDNRNVSFNNNLNTSWNTEFYNISGQCKYRAWFITEWLNDSCIDGVNITVCKNSTVIVKKQVKCEGE